LFVVLLPHEKHAKVSRRTIMLFESQHVSVFQLLQKTKILFGIVFENGIRVGLFDL